MNNAGKEILYRAARFRGSLCEAKMKSWSGADKVDAELHRLECVALRQLADEKELEKVLDDLKTEWKGFAEIQNKYVDQAPKLKTGPRSGHSSIADRWAFPEKYQDSLIFIRKVFRDAVEADRPDDSAEQSELRRSGQPSRKPKKSEKS